MVTLLHQFLFYVLKNKEFLGKYSLCPRDVARGEIHALFAQRAKLFMLLLCIISRYARENSRK